MILQKFKRWGLVALGVILVLICGVGVNQYITSQELDGVTKDTTLIKDKRTDYVSAIPGQTFCVERNITAGSIVSPRWDGNLSIVSIDAVSYSTETYTVDVPVMGNCTGAEYYVDGKILNQLDCEKEECVWNASKDNTTCTCSREITYECQKDVKKEERTRQVATYTPIKSSIKTTKDSKALEVQDKLSTATKALTKEAYSTTATNGLTRFCFKAPTWEELRAGAKTAGEISYVAYTDTKYDACESTWWSIITTGNSYVANFSINLSTAAILDTFKFNWNGSNYSIYNPNLVLLHNFNNNSNLAENGSKITDISKYGNNGTCSANNLLTVGCPIWNASSGKYGGAFNFNGYTDFCARFTIWSFFNYLSQSTLILRTVAVTM